jgi:hypothetical protein
MPINRYFAVIFLSISFQWFSGTLPFIFSRSAMAQTTTLDVSSVTLTLQDLPSGYIQSPWSISRSEGSFLSFEKDTDFIHNRVFTVVVANNSLAEKYHEYNPEQWQKMKIMLEASLFYVAISNMESMLEDSFHLTEGESLNLPPNLGHVAAGRRYHIESQDVRPFLDTVMFIRGGVTIIVGVLFFEGDADAVSVVELAQILDRRIPIHQY